MYQTNTTGLHRFRWMGYAFIAMALFFSGGAYLFPSEAPVGLYDWIYLTAEEKESFYMISGIFIVAGVYCLRKKN